LKAIILVGLGGFLGSVSRYLLSTLIGKSQWFNSSLPPTLFVNLVGCLLIGILLGYSEKLSKEMLLIATTGFCGGFTTFSTFSFESMQLIQKGSFKLAGLYIGLSIVVGLVFTVFGYWIAKSNL